MIDLIRLVGASGMGEAPAVAEKVEVDGLTVSTVDSYDMGYETAILDVKGAYPVERYDTKEQALAGHRAWIKKAETLTEVVELGYGDLLDERTVRLERSQ